VEGAKITYSTQDGNAYLSARNGRYGTSDKDGMIRMVLGGYNNFWELTKPGYQFDLTRQMSWRFGVLYKNDLRKYDKKNPLIIYGWRRGEEPTLVTSVGAIYGFGEGVECTVSLLKASKGNRLDQDIKLKYKITGEWEKITDEELLTINPDQQYKLKNFHATLEVPGAGIKRTEDVFMHEADEANYQERVVFDSEYRREYIHFYIRENTGRYYGGAIVWAKHPLPGSKGKSDDVKNIRGSVRAKFWFNLEGSPNIMRAENADWSARKELPADPDFRCEEYSVSSD